MMPFKIPYLAPLLAAGALFLVLGAYVKGYQKADTRCLNSRAQAETEVLKKEIEIETIQKAIPRPDDRAVIERLRSGEF